MKSTFYKRPNISFGRKTSWAVNNGLTSIMNYEVIYQLEFETQWVQPNSETVNIERRQKLFLTRTIVLILYLFDISFICIWITNKIIFFVLFFWWQMTSTWLLFESYTMLCGSLRTAFTSRERLELADNEVTDIPSQTQNGSKDESRWKAHLSRVDSSLC